MRIKPALVTGASRGIGRAIALRLLGEDYSVVGTYNSGHAEVEELSRSGKKTWKDKPIPTGTIADAHTHPNALDPKPSGGDQADATRLNLPFYVVTRDAIWKAVPKQDAPVPVAGSDWWKDAWNRDKQGKLKCK